MIVPVFIIIYLSYTIIDKNNKRLYVNYLLNIGYTLRSISNMLKPPIFWGKDKLLFFFKQLEKLL